MQVRENPPAVVAGPQARKTGGERLEMLWNELEQVLPRAGRQGRPYKHSRRVILEAILYVQETDCGWQHMPRHFPPWKTVYAQWAQWQRTGVWQKITTVETATETDLQL
jgi:transposase